MRKFKLLFCLFCANIALAEGEGALTDSVPFYKMSLEQLMNVSVSVVSDQPEIGREFADCNGCYKR